MNKQNILIAELETKEPKGTYRCENVNINETKSFRNRPCPYIRIGQRFVTSLFAAVRLFIQSQKKTVSPLMVSKPSATKRLLKKFSKYYYSCSVF